MSESRSVYTAYQGNSYLFGGNAPYVEEMYENYLANPGSVPENWREYFDALQHVPAVDGSNAKDVPHLPVVNAFAERAKQGGTKVVIAGGELAAGEPGQHDRLLVEDLLLHMQRVVQAHRRAGERVEQGADARLGALEDRLRVGVDVGADHERHLGDRRLGRRRRRRLFAR